MYGRRMQDSPGTVGFNLKMNKTVLIFGTDVS